MSILGTVAAGVIGLFKNDRASDTVIDIVRNATGANDLTDKERVDKLIEYIDKTKHQSQTRRVIAILTVLGMMTFTGSWLILAMLQGIYEFLMIDTSSLAKATETANLAAIKTAPLIKLQNNIYTMGRDVLKDPFMLVFGFYFATQIVTGWSSNKK